ncbi:branched-chain amino acid ABC transporter permease [Streptomyces actuosus]|uniref:Branched-chain amino acid ABC transporter permease n=1 Tax=Streptomyces actuosus TaxID=1885 RepID=A0ABS2VZM2_STRAS|nr:branched-chain amino acid ABC transporter permease [Streptomyces actuosus]MBN0048473.1 branched-chain amino acid ABC transporter permease [Streptomyces actuosus]
MNDFLQYTLNGLTVGAFYALVALGYTMVYGIIRLLNFAHGDFFMVGAFLATGVLSLLTGSGLPSGLVVVVALVAATAAAAALGGVSARIVYLPLVKAPKLSLLVSALGLSLAVEYGTALSQGTGFRSVPHIGFLSAEHAIGLTDGVRLTYAQLGVIAVSLALMIGLYLYVTRTFTGTAMRVLAMDQDAARLMGVNVERTIMMTFIIGAGLAGTAGTMYALYYPQVNFLMGFLLGLRAFTAAVLGGIGNIPGAMVGGFLIGLLESYATGYVAGRWTDVVVFGVLIGVLVIRPSGILGERVAERV